MRYERAVGGEVQRFAHVDVRERLLGHVQRQALPYQARVVLDGGELLELLQLSVVVGKSAVDLTRLEGQQHRVRVGDDLEHDGRKVRLGAVVIRVAHQHDLAVRHVLGDLVRARADGQDLWGPVVEKVLRYRRLLVDEAADRGRELADQGVRVRQGRG